MLHVYIGETSKTIKSRITELKNSIKREDTRSIPATHVRNNDHRFDWNKTTILDHAETRQAREFKEAWHSLRNPAINRHIDIPPAYQKLKELHKSTKGSRTTNQDSLKPRINKKSPENRPINAHQNQPIIIRRSLRLHNRKQIKEAKPWWKPYLDGWNRLYFTLQPNNS